MTPSAFNGFLIGLLLSFTCVLIGFVVERSREREPRRFGSISFNVGYSSVVSVIQALLQPAAAAITVYLVHVTGQGFINLPDTGWRLIPALLAYIIAMDFGEYVFHRAQHSISPLWAMHSLHHSDPDVNVSTTARHYWAEHFIKSLTIYLAVGIIFKANPIIVGIYTLTGFYNYFTHARLPVSFGRYSVLLNSPCYHRIHHSIFPADENINFAALFPIFDRMFGTYRSPLRSEFPETGLSSLEAPSGIIGAMAWPIRTLPRQLLRLQAR
jgi:sterol desaturase/sphingolipid hydroxylase (fatty acid hydroxylase superfamily)